LSFRSPKIVERDPENFEERLGKFQGDPREIISRRLELGEILGRLRKELETKGA